MNQCNQDTFYFASLMVKVDISRGDSAEVLQDSMLASRGESVSGVLHLIQKVSKTHYSELITLWKPIQGETLS